MPCRACTSVMSRGPRQANAPVADDARRRTGRHDHHAIGKRNRLLQIVGHKQHRLAVRAPQIEQQIAHDLARLGIERPERLVHQQNLGIADQDLREADALALAAREHVRITMGKRAKADLARKPCARSSASRRGVPSISSAMATLSIAVFQGNSASAWKR